MRLINTQTLQYPVTLDDIKVQNPNTSFPDVYDYVPEGYAKVLPSNSPEFDKYTQTINEKQPINKDGMWYQVWEVVNLSKTKKDEIKAIEETSIRRMRDSLLSACDWTQLPDVTLPNKADWDKYRQQLRDITSQPGFPLTVTWPTTP